MASGRVNSLTDNFENAYLYSVHSANLRDSLNLINSNLKIVEFEAKYNLSEKERIAEIEKNDTVFARIQKFNELIEPQLAVLEDRALKLATTFLLGYLKGHLPVEKIEEISRELKKFIERDL